MYAVVFLICGLVFSIMGLANPSDESMIPVMFLGFALFFGSLVYLKTKADREKKEIERKRSIARKDKAIEIDWAKKKAEADYSVGERVKHNIFGEGTVLSVKKISNDAMLEIAFDSVGTKKLMANFAKITKI